MSSQLYGKQKACCQRSWTSPFPVLHLEASGQGVSPGGPLKWGWLAEHWAHGSRIHQGLLAAHVVKEQGPRWASSQGQLGMEGGAEAKKRPQPAGEPFLGKLMGGRKGLQGHRLSWNSPTELGRCTVRKDTDIYER